MNLKWQKKFSGFAILTSTWIFLIFTSALLISAHFLTERIKAIKRLDRIEGRIHRLHQKNHRGSRKFWPTFDKPAPEREKVTRRKKIKKHHIAIDFGGRE